MDWWYWLVTDSLLIGGLTGWQWGILPAIGLTIIQAMHYLARESGIAAFPGQVRPGYLLLLVPGTYQPLDTACRNHGRRDSRLLSLARIMALMPWNRSRALTMALAWHTFVSPPVAGSILTS